MFVNLAAQYAIRLHAATRQVPATPGVPLAAADAAALPAALKRLRWSTPMHARREFQGRRVPTRGEAVWHQPEGPFDYGRFSVRSIRFDEAA